MPSAAWKSSIDAGALIRGQVKRGLRAAAFTHDIDLIIHEDWGLFSSLIMLHARGEEENVIEFRRVINIWFQSITGDKS